MTTPLQRPRSLQSLTEQQRSAQTGGKWSPSPLASIEDTGLTKLSLADHVLKILYFGGDLTGSEVAERIRLPFAGVCDGVFEFLKREKYVEVRGAAQGYSEATYRYMISSKGIEKAQETLARSQYAGPAPVPLAHYIASVYEQNKERKTVTANVLRGVMDELVISDEMLNKVGPAVNSGRSIFLYGPPGNGKTTIADRVGRMVLGEDIWIPYSIDVDGQVIQMYDSLNHELADSQERLKYATGMVADQRWVQIKRPMIMVGGELTLQGLDLTYDPTNKFYEAPFQMKANGGLFLIDDFGRQQVRAVDLLNRWIVPLEKRSDFLTLNNGRKIEIPFNVLIVFSTNLDPKDLVDEAFLRRIRHKIEVGNPNMNQFREIFQIMCKVMRVPYDENGLKYLIKKWYIDKGRDLRMVHPRDILSQLLDISNYQQRPPELTPEMIDAAAASYFVEL
jgi:hypothetical protein